MESIHAVDADATPTASWVITEARAHVGVSSDGGRLVRRHGRRRLEFEHRAESARRRTKLVIIYSIRREFRKSSSMEDTRITEHLDGEARSIDGAWQQFLNAVGVRT